MNTAHCMHVYKSTHVIFIALTLPQGKDGADGEKGRAGPAGEQGVQGQDGPQGRKGPDGKSVSGSFDSLVV